MASSSSSASLVEVKKLVEAVLAGDAAEVAKLLDANNGALSPNTVFRKIRIFFCVSFSLQNAEDKDCVPSFWMRFSVRNSLRRTHAIRVTFAS